MNKNVARLFEIANKKSRIIIGLMSGTSLDGLDIGCFEITDTGKNSNIKVLKFETFSYPNEIKQKIKQVFAKKTIEFEYLTVLNAFLGNYHGQLINQFLSKYKIKSTEVDLIASHGQTVFHAPKIQHQLSDFPNATMQIADADHIAVSTGIITVSDFRQKHIAAGGEGAPLAVYGDYLIFTDLHENRIMLNIGGIANFTYLPKNAEPNEVFVTDTGPGNTLIDATINNFFPEKYFDKNAEIATKGHINFNLLNELKVNDFFNKAFPKTTGPEVFNLNYLKKAQQNSNTLHLSAEDTLATLTRFTAETIAAAIIKAVSQASEFSIYLSGGGMHNPLIIKYLKELLVNFEFKNIEDIGINGDAKEALLFAVLANETVAGNALNFGDNLAIPSVKFGKISFPD